MATKTTTITKEIETTDMTTTTGFRTNTNRILTTNGIIKISITLNQKNKAMS